MRYWVIESLDFSSWHVNFIYNLVIGDWAQPKYHQEQDYLFDHCGSDIAADGIALIFEIVSTSYLVAIMINIMITSTTHIVLQDSLWGTNPSTVI